MKRSAFAPYFCAFMLFSYALFTTVSADPVTIVGPVAFSTLDGSSADHDGAANGVFTVDDGPLIVKGQITCLDEAPLPVGAGGCAIALAVSGDLTLEAGSAILTENRRGAGAGGAITLTVGGKLTLKGTTGSTPGAVVSSGRPVPASGPVVGVAGGILATVGGRVDVRAGAVVSAENYWGEAGAITVTGAQVTVGGLVASSGSRVVTAVGSPTEVLAVTQPGWNARAQSAGPIWLIGTGGVSPAVEVGSTGAVVSQGRGGRVPTVGLEGCGVVIKGLVAALTEEGTSRVTVRSGRHLVVDGRDLGGAGARRGRVRADALGRPSDPPQVRLLATGPVSLFGAPIGTGAPFAVSADAVRLHASTAGAVTALSQTSTLHARGRAVSAGLGQRANRGGNVTLQAQGLVTLDDAEVSSLGDPLAQTALGGGGRVGVRSFASGVRWRDGVGDVRPTGSTSGVAAARQGRISVTACTTSTTSGTSFPVNGAPVGALPVVATDCTPTQPPLPADEPPLADCADPPTAVDDAYSTPYQTVLAVPAPGVLGNDTGPGIAATPLSGAATTQGGTVTLAADGSFSYTPPTGFLSPPTDSFTYTVSNGDGSDTAVVTITVRDARPTVTTTTPAPGATQVPPATQPTVTFSEPVTLGTTWFQVVCSSSGTQATPATTWTGGPTTYTIQTTAFTAGESCTATVFASQVSDTDGLGDATMAANYVFSFSVDAAPVAVTDSATVAEDAAATTIAVLTNDTDADGGGMSIASATDPANGTVVITGGGTGLTYQPDAAYCNTQSGGTPDTFTYTLTPGGSTATVSVTVTCVDDAPVAVNDTATVTEDAGATAVAVLGNDTDTDGGPMGVGSVTQPANGTVVITGGGTGLTYQPAANYCNIPPGTTPDTFTYTLTPGGSTATVSVGVACADDAPVAVNDAATVSEDAAATAVPVLANDTDVDGGPMAILSASAPAHGTVAITGGGTGLTYQPDARTAIPTRGGRRIRSRTR